MRAPILAAFVLSCAVAPALPSETTTLVVCAPGYPSDTVEAQPTMDALARGVATAAGWAAGRLSAAYHPTIDGGLEALGREETGLAIVPLPFYLEQRERLGLEPLLNVVQASGDTEVWSLVARRGAVEEAPSLAGWQVAGMPGYSPRFVRRIALGEWGALPQETQVVFSSRVLSDLRRAAAGDPVAAILDQGQTGALESLPFASELEVVTRSRPLIGSLLCRVEDRLSDTTAHDLREAFLALDRREDGRALLETLRITRFEPVDRESLAAVERTFGTVETPSR
jgi:hypothetical protein